MERDFKKLEGLDLGKVCGGMDPEPPVKWITQVFKTSCYRCGKEITVKLNKCLVSYNFVAPSSICSECLDKLRASRRRAL